jgi:Flp pilus assembly protein TadG
MSFLRDNRGVAAIEAVLLLPVMIFIIIGGVEAYSFVRTDSILDRAVYTIASGVSMQHKLETGSCNKTDVICTYGAIMEDLTQPLDFTRYGQVTISYYTTEKSGTASLWKGTPQWAYAKGIVNNADFTCPASAIPTMGGYEVKDSNTEFPALLQPERDGTTDGRLIVAEISYTYQPYLMSSNFWAALGGNRTLYHRAYFRARGYNLGICP